MTINTDTIALMDLLQKVIAGRANDAEIDDLIGYLNERKAAQPAPAPEDGELICPFCQSQNRLMHPHHVTSMGAVCAASGLPHFEAVKLARSLPVMDGKEPPK